MSELPILSGKEIIKVLSRIGYYVVRQRGSHIRLYCLDRKPITIPNYKSIDRSLLRKILRDAQISDEEFLKFYRSA
ncbi:MAG: type II toxin-antitoxin system HicA family toxin [Ignavibacteriales bacterium]|nr:type II toxin-antitoxin system HicA family toxin [Ignavibacteriales bacterium]